MPNDWRAIPGWEGLYEINREGQVRRTARLVGGGRHQGYPVVQLSDQKNGRSKRIYIHRLVCQLFNGPAPSPEHEVAHNDGDRTNCRADNLRWATRYENMQDKRSHGTQPMGEKIWLAKLTDAQVELILSSPLSNRKIAEAMGVNASTIYAIRSGQTWKHIPRKGAK